MLDGSKAGAGNVGLRSIRELQNSRKIAARRGQRKAVFQTRRKAGVLEEQSRVNHFDRLETRASFGYIQPVHFQLFKGRITALYGRQIISVDIDTDDAAGGDRINV